MIYLTNRDLNMLEYLVHDAQSRCYGHPTRKEEEIKLNKLFGKLLDFRIPFRKCKTAQLCVCMRGRWKTGDIEYEESEYLYRHYNKDYRHFFGYDMKYIKKEDGVKLKLEGIK